MRSLLVSLLVIASCSIGCKSFSGEEPAEADAGAETPDASQPPCPNGALSFGGKAFVKVESPDAFATPGHLTVEAWVFPDAQIGDTEADIVSHHDDNNSDGWVLRIRKGLVFRLYSGPGNATKSAANVTEAVDTTLTLGRWHHVAAVVDAMAKSITLFIDGKSQGQNYREKVTADAYDGPLTIGASAFLGGNGFKGMIDEVRVSRAVRYKDATSFKPVYPLPDAEDLTIGTWHFPSDKSPADQVTEATGKFTSTLATFAAPPEFPANVLMPSCPTGARP